jgi:hypothetical protein
MPRRIVHPYGQSIPITRAFSLLFALAVLGMLYERMRDPATWVWFTGENPAAVDVSPQAVQPAAAPPKELIVAGPNDLDPDAVAEMALLLKPVRDKTDLVGREMPAYWRLMEWSLSQPFAQLEQRALRDVPFQMVWSDPDRYRGKLVRMRMHVRRVLQHDAPGNPLKLKEVFEVYAWTDDSLSHPYVVVIPECPPGLPVGSDVHGEIVFVGYFLKIMRGEAFDKLRGYPLFIGRARSVARPAPANAGQSGLDLFLILFAVGGLMLAGIFWFAYSRRSGVSLSRAGLPSASDAPPFWEQANLGAHDGERVDSIGGTLDFTNGNGDGDAK